MTTKTSVITKCSWFLLLFLLLLLFFKIESSEGAVGPRGWGTRFGRAPLLERFAWRILDWNYPSELSRQQALASGDFQPENALPVGIEIWRDKLFVSVPRWKNGQSIFIFNLR